jgi:hypothetical protein
MEPFIIFCLALVGYCGYLTVGDLLRDLQIVPAVTVHKAAAQFKKQVAARQSPSGRLRVPVANGRVAGAFGQLASL